MANLKTLDLSFNRLKELPVVMGQPECQFLHDSLQTFIVKNNQLRTCGPVCSLLNLLTLDLSHNRLVFLPKVLVFFYFGWWVVNDRILASLENVIYSHIEELTFRDIVQGISEIHNLVTLKIDDNQLKVRRLQLIHLLTVLNLSFLFENLKRRVYLSGTSIAPQKSSSS